MEVLQNIDSDLTQALKAKDELAALTLRQLKSSIANAEIAGGRKGLTEDQVIKLLRSEVKKRKEAADLYQKGGREELAEKENAEIEVIAKYLPAEMDEAQIKAKVEEIIKKVGASGPADMGKVIGPVMQELGSAVDGSVVSRLAKDALS